MSPDLPVADAAALAEPITVLHVDADDAEREAVHSALSDDDFEVRTEERDGDALGRLDGVDCVVAAPGAGLLATVRDRYATLPVVLFVADLPEPTAEAVRGDDWAAVFRRDGDRVRSLLAGRVRRLVGHRRTTTVAGRALTALETSGDGVALVDADGTVQFANKAFASRFDRTVDDLSGGDWRDCFPADEVDRLERTALDSVAQGWLWTGTCRGRRPDGETFTARTRITGLSDGGLVFVLSDPEV